MFANIKQGEIEKFEEYSQFGSRKEFYHHLWMWLADKKRDFSKRELVGLKRLVRFVAITKIKTLLKALLRVQRK